MSRDYSEIISALYRPLSFGLRNNGANLPKIGNFFNLVRTLLDEAAALPQENLASEDSALLAALRADLSGIEQAEHSEQIERLKKVLQRLEIRHLESPPKKRMQHDGVEAAAKKVRREPPIGEGLKQPLTTVAKIGKATAQKLAKKNILTIEDALLDLPLRYEDRAELSPISEVKPDKWVTVRGRVKNAQVSMTFRKRRVLTVLIEDASGCILAKWFFYRGKAPDRRFEKGNELILSGPLGIYRGHLEFHHPEVEVLDRGESQPEAQVLPQSQVLEERMVPIYALTEGLNQRFYRALQKRIARDYAQLLPETLPQTVRERFSFPPLAESVFYVHCPDKDTDLLELNNHRSPAQRRIIFEELFFLALSIEIRRRKVSQLQAPVLKGRSGGRKEDLLTYRFQKALPFPLTRAQKKVIREIFLDVAEPLAMNRLLQGDVGCGKTVVAVMAALRAIESGYQVAFMAPTEILAEQHLLTIEPYLRALGVKSACLLGNTGKKEREEILSGACDGTLQLVFGTHALIQEDVQFAQLGLVVVDEQHRFGVLQRVALRKKGLNPHALVMTATPIPRTLAMTVYGDLSVSVINEMPPGRSPVDTRIVRDANVAYAHRRIEQEVQKGSQVYVVYPIIEESETLDLKNALEMFEHLRRAVFPTFRLGLLHGRMKVSERDEVMQKFKSGELQVLVSTTVIEVGIDVPNATLMVIENAERFGLAQLHQLRGRVGRGKKKAQCLLVASVRLTSEANLRLKTMAQTNDGFRIAEEDLRIRGPGEVLGVRQAGMPIFCYADIRRDAEILDQAKLTAQTLLAEDPQLASEPNRVLKTALMEKWQGRLQLSRIG